MVFTDINATHANRTVSYVIKTADQVYKAGLGTSRTADDSDSFAGTD